MLEFGDFVVRAWTYAPGTRQPRHAHDHSNVTIVTAGQIEEGSDHGQYCAGASSVVLKAAGCEHDDRVSGFGAKTLTIEFMPDSTFGRCIAPDAWSWFETPEIVRRALGLQQAFVRGDASVVEGAAASLVESVAGRPSASSSVPPWVEKICRILEERFDESIRFDRLARDFGLHPVYASRAFRRYAGVAMSDYLRSLRLRRARHELSTTRRSIAAIAAQSGFADASHLCRTFSALLGMTPKIYRRITQEDRSGGRASSPARRTKTSALQSGSARSILRAQ